ncbi:MAG TPA: FecR family protein [Candidatus Mcinerneyibacteriales bacterium]|mgnify:CR=1 FL=1|nr:FecR family protein [Candidatus Mcinerneyibacteriales bacterium]
MKRRMFLFAIIVLLTASAGAQEIGRGVITALEGEAEKRQAPEADWLEAALEMDIYSKEMVRTLPESFAEISLSRGSVIRLAPKTTVNMNKLYEEAEDKIVTNIEVAEGEIWGNVNKTGEDELFSVDSTAVSSSIIGTVFRIDTGEDGTLIKVYRGNVEVSGKPAPSKDEPAADQPREIEGPTEVEGPREVTLEEWTVIVREMMELKVDAQGRIVRMDSINTMSADEQSAWVKWNQKRDMKSPVKH